MLPKKKNEKKAWATHCGRTSIPYMLSVDLITHTVRVRSLSAWQRNLNPSSIELSLWPIVRSARVWSVCLSVCGFYVYSTRSRSHICLRHCMKSAVFARSTLISPSHFLSLFLPLSCPGNASKISLVAISGNSAVKFAFNRSCLGCANCVEILEIFFFA